MTYLSGTIIVLLADAPGLKLFKELGFVSNDALITWVTANIVPAIESRIATPDLTGQSYTADTVPPAVKLAGHQAGANVLIYMRANREGPFTTNPQGFNLQIPVFTSFTPEIVETLRSFRKDCTEQLASSEYKTDGMKATWEEN